MMSLRLRLLLERHGLEGLRRRDELFMAQVDRSAGPDGCWPWTGRRNAQGYGYFGDTLANRESWRVYHGDYAPHTNEQGERLYTLHSCDNPPCMNPAHLRLGTHAENMRDMVRRGRHCSYRPGYGRWLKERKRLAAQRRNSESCTTLSEGSAALS